MTEKCGNLAPSARCDLAPIAPANPLVSRGIADLERGSFLHPHYTAKAQAALDKADYDEVIRICDKAIKGLSEAIPLNPVRAQIYARRGIAWREKKHYDNAMRDFDKAICLDPGNALYYFFRGLAWMDDKDDDDQAILDFHEAICLDPENPVYYYRRGLAWMANCEFDKAIMDFEKVILLDPNDATIYCRIASLLAIFPDGMIRDSMRAIQIATRACELTDWKSGEELDTLAECCARAGQFDEAVRYQMKALQAPDYRGSIGDEFHQRLELYKQKKFQQSP